MDADNRDFCGKDLRGRSFKGQNRAGADFSDAQLGGVNFLGADLTGAKFCRAMMGHSRENKFVLWIVQLEFGSLADMLLPLGGIALFAALRAYLAELEAPSAPPTRH